VDAAERPQGFLRGRAQLRAIADVHLQAAHVVAPGELAPPVTNATLPAKCFISLPFRFARQTQTAPDSYAWVPQCGKRSRSFSFQNLPVDVRGTSSIDS
jgi:hypothetical protein